MLIVAVGSFGQMIFPSLNGEGKVLMASLLAKIFEVLEGVDGSSAEVTDLLNQPPELWDATRPKSNTKSQKGNPLHYDF